MEQSTKQSHVTEVKIDSGDPELNEKIAEYLEYSVGLETGQGVLALLDAGRYDELRRILMSRLSFGTAGLRGRMGPGYAAINELVIIQTSQGLATYVEKMCPLNRKRVVIGCDCRHNSSRFTHLAAISFLMRGFKVFHFSTTIPTPFIPFSVKHLNCFAGIMITASHNPKEDNGYKVYWENGAQILPPHDKNIQESILANLRPWNHATETSLLWTSPLCQDACFDMPLIYLKSVLENCCFDHIPKSAYKHLWITITAMHGVSHVYMKKAFEMLDFTNYLTVKEQMYPDPEFPTVTFPNPEEKNCLDLAIKTADKHHSTLILANDPDADRLAVAEKLNDGSWHIYSGNEVGALLGYWMWMTFQSDYKMNPRKCHMVSSAVSSKILRSISEVEGFCFNETLTGFKWMANKAFQLMNEKLHFVFAFEEAIGYMCGTSVLDKDGINAGLQMTKMAVFTYSNGKILHDVLKEIYRKYGYHVSCNSYFISHDPQKIKAMFHRLRNFDGIDRNYPSHLPGEKPFTVSGVRDLTTGFDNTQPDGCAVLPCSSSTEMITFYFQNGCELTLRTSGTEPKVKYYSEIIAKVSEAEWPKKKALLHQMVDLIITHWIEPEKNGFLPRPT